MSLPSRGRLVPIPGKQCPAWRTSKSNDPRVTVDQEATTPHTRQGTRERCGTCGRENVRVHQTQGRVRRSAWYYFAHTAPG